MGSLRPLDKTGQGESVEPPQPSQVKTPGQIVGSRAVVRGDDDGRAAGETQKKE